MLSVIFPLWNATQLTNDWTAAHWQILKHICTLTFSSALLPLLKDQQKQKTHHVLNIDRPELYQAKIASYFRAPAGNIFSLLSQSNLKSLSLLLAEKGTALGPRRWAEDVAIFAACSFRQPVQKCKDYCCGWESKGAPEFSRGSLT